MNSKQTRVDPVPDEFASYEAAAKFWDAHDTTDYPELFQTVNVRAELRRRHYEVQVDEDVMVALRARTKKLGIPVSRIASDMLRQQLSATA